MWPKILAGLCCLLVLSHAGGHSQFLNQRDECVESLPESDKSFLNSTSLFPDTSYVEELLSRPEEALRISRVVLEHKTWARGLSIAVDHDRWPHKIPYVIDDSFAAEGKNKTLILKRALQRIMDNVCVVYHDVTEKWDRSNKNWFVENGFENNAYILFRSGSGCSVGSGYKPIKGGPSKVNPCTDFSINTHEVLHTFGVGHTQQLPSKDNYLTVNFDNIRPSLKWTYSKTVSSNYLDAGFDAKSSLLYSDKTWNRNGLETYWPIRDDMFNLDVGLSSEATVFYELSQVYRCNEIYCNNSQVDCGPGYFTLNHGECRCVCPPEFDPETNCQKLFNYPNSLPWPKTPMAVFAGGESHGCPREFNQQAGWFNFQGTRHSIQNQVPVLFPKKDEYIYLPICAKDEPDPPGIDWESWPPGGGYCIIKSKVADCGGAFTESSVTVESVSTVQYNGSIGDIDITGKTVQMKFCCRYDENERLTMNLPNADPFGILSVYDCPLIEGMRDYKGSFYLYTNNKSVTGELPPRNYHKGEAIRLYQCYYQPPVYGCNQQINLNKKTRSVTVTTPGFKVAREPNRRCIYQFIVPENVTIRITFNTYDVQADDIFHVKRYYKWQEPYRIDNANRPYQFVSERDFLMMEYWSSWKTAKNKGVNFTADIILAEDSCYNKATNGEDYFGDTAVSETYEECLPWSDAVGCADFPTKGMDPIFLLTSGNKCRNPGGELRQPWCYTYRNGTNCRKRYCDVCNYLTPVDVLKCSSLKSQVPHFCKTGIQRFGCFKTCGFTQASNKRATCKNPVIPSDGTVVGSLKSSYLQGEKVLVQCSKQPDAITGEILCTKEGWTKLTSACNGTACADTITKQTCERILRLVPDFCLDDRFKATAEQFCRKSCGACTGSCVLHTAKCKLERSSTYTMSSNSSSISAGEVMNYTCNSKLFYVSGDMKRACSSTGVMLGKPLVCQAKPVAQDVNLNMVRLRKDSYPGNLALLLNATDLRVPFNGVITKWYYYCIKSAEVYFLVYRQIGSSYTYIGSNKVKCETGWIWSFNVPTVKQISVKKGDIVGVYSANSNTFSSSNCQMAEDVIARNPFVQVKSFQDLMTAKFDGEKCFIPSVGYRIELDFQKSG